MSSDLFLIEGKKLVPMTEQAYDSEEVLQRLIAEHPELLAGRQVDPAAPRRWMLVAREAAVPGEEGGGARWSVDHLFLDQEGIPTLVEVKRSSDTRIRREVVGQMLDYAANGVAYWPGESLKAAFESNCAREGRDAQAALSALLGPEGDAVSFWAQVHTNLQAGRIRMVFVADQIPAELLRIVEFLNGQMREAEVLALEVRQYVGEGVATLAPHVLGQTAQAAAAKAGGGRGARQWDEGSFVETLQRQRGDEAVAGARSVLDWARRNGLEVRWGRGGTDGSFSPRLDGQAAQHWFVTCYTYGRMEILFQYMGVGPFADEGKREILRERFNRVPGVAIRAEALSGRPRLELAALQDEPTRTAVFAALDWALAEARAWEAAQA